MQKKYHKIRAAQLLAARNQARMQLKTHVGDIE